MRFTITVHTYSFRIMVNVCDYEFGVASLNISIFGK
jgi:hypothetical protein